MAHIGQEQDGTTRQNNMGLVCRRGTTGNLHLLPVLVRRGQWRTRQLCVAHGTWCLCARRAVGWIGCGTNPIAHSTSCLGLDSLLLVFDLDACGCLLRHWKWRVGTGLLGRCAVSSTELERSKSSGIDSLHLLLACLDAGCLLVRMVPQFAESIGRRRWPETFAGSSAVVGTQRDKLQTNGSSCLGLR